MRLDRSWRRVLLVAAIGQCNASGEQELGCKVPNRCTVQRRYQKELEQRAVVGVVGHDDTEPGAESTDDEPDQRELADVVEV